MEIKDNSNFQGKTVTKETIIEQLMIELNLDRSKALSITNNFFNILTDAIKSEERIEIRGFGVFTSKKRPPRLAKDPHTGKSVSVPERIKIRFKPGKELKEIINKGNFD